VAIGMFSGCVGLFIDFWLAQIAKYHKILSDWGFWYFALSALIAAGFSTTFTHVVCPQSAGSGLPFMKVAISGVDMNEFLSVRCVLTKIVGLVAAFAAGLSIGKEGPFIMISCGFANILMNLPMFSRINNDESKRLEILACACAAGVAATFGSPFGGVLFGVEVTSHFYMVHNLPRSFFSAIVGALVVNFIALNSRYGLFGSSNLGISEVNDLHIFSMTDLIVFVGIGILCGLGGALFNYCISVLVLLRDRYLSKASSEKTSANRVFWNGLGKRLVMVGFITFITSLSEFYGDSAWFIRHGSPHRILASLFSRREKTFSDVDMAEEDSVLLSRSLVTYLPLKYVLTLLSVVLPIPAGLFTPTFVIGGIFGRLVGEAVIAFDIYQTQYEPFEFAIIGAGAFSSGVTHAISTAVIIMEVSHNDSLNIPVSVAILSAYFTAKRFTENVYDMLITTSHLPRLKKLPKAAYDIPAWEVMRDVKVMKFLTADSTYQEAKEMLEKSIEPVFPIVESSENLFLLATVTRKRLEEAMLYCQHKMNETHNQNENNDRVPLDIDGLYVHTPLVTDDLKLDLKNWRIHFVFRRGGKIMEWVCKSAYQCLFLITFFVNPTSRVPMIFVQEPSLVC
jgi:chloride channel 2